MKFRKILSMLMCAAIMMCMGSCGDPEVAGDNLINQAREDYVSLNSAKVVMTNTQTGEVEQTFTFKYDEKDVLIYSYFGKSGDNEYAEYNNGAESFTYQDKKYTHYTKGDSNYVQYVRDVTHPQADKGLIIFSPSDITDAKLEVVGDVTEVTHVYDVEKIGAEVESGKATGFAVKYFFDSNDKLLYFIETTTGETDGKEQIYSYKVEITQQNAVDKVENTTEKYKPQE